MINLTHDQLLKQLQEHLGEPSKYIKWYVNLMIARSANIKIKGDYLENHHALPKCIYGPNEALVALTFREHYLAHLFLALHARKMNNKPQLKKFSLPLRRMRGLKKNQYDEKINCRPFSRTYDLAKRVYSDASSGSSNSFYGKKHTPLTLAKIKATRLLNGNYKQTQETKNKISIGLKGKMDGYVTFFDQETLTERRIHPNEVDEFIKNNTSFKRGLLVTQNRIDSYEVISLKNTGFVRPKGADSCHYGKITIKNLETNDCKRIDHIELEEYINRGYVRGVIIPQEIKDRAAIARSKALTGRKMPIDVVNRVNKDPEKIRKTAEKHRGMKRTAETCEKIRVKAILRGKLPQETKDKISIACKKRPSNRKGVKIYFHPNDPTKIFNIKEGDEINPEWIKGHPKKMKEYEHLFKK